MQSITGGEQPTNRQSIKQSMTIKTTITGTVNFVPFRTAPNPNAPTPTSGIPEFPVTTILTISLITSVLIATLLKKSKCKRSSKKGTPELNRKAN